MGEKSFAKNDTAKLDYETRYGDFKTPDTIKPSTILDIVQDIATRHSSECGYGMHRLKEMGIAWLMQGIKLHFDAPVKTMTLITANTAVKNMKGVISERGTILEQNGVAVAKTVAAWFMFDTNKMRPCRIPVHRLSSPDVRHAADSQWVRS